MNYINFIVYSLIIFSLIIGIKIAPRKSFNDDFLSLNAMTSLKGVMALFVLFHHISQQKAFSETGTISIFSLIGFLFVGIFFFCSGYGLYKSYSVKENYLVGFPKKRILPIILSYYVMIAIYAAFYLVKGNDFSPIQWILKLTGLILINSQSWFVYVIAIMYFAFYIVFKNEKLRKNALLIISIVALLQGLLFIINGHFPWWIGESGWWKNPAVLFSSPWWKHPCALLFEGEWWVNSTFSFVFGIFIAQKEKAFIEWTKKNYALKFIVTTIIFVGITILGLFVLQEFGYWTEFGGDLGTWKKGLTYIIQNIQVVITCFFVIILMRKIYVSNRFYNFLGKRSLEIYLIQEMILFSFLFLIQSENTPILKPHNTNLILNFVLVTLCVLICATLQNLINKFIISKTLQRK